MTYGKKETECQFHQRFFARFICMKARFLRQNFIRKLYFEFEIFGTKIAYENRAQKTLMKLTQSVSRRERRKEKKKNKEKKIERE